MIHELFKIFNWLGSEWVLITLFVLSILTVWIILQRYFQIRSLNNASLRFWAEHADNWFQDAKTLDWFSKENTLRNSYPCLETEALNLVSQSLELPKEEAERSLQAYLDTRQMKLERNVSILGTIGANAPFVGLLGTVLGIIRAFHDMSLQGIGGSGMDSISSGIAEALVATAIGLFVAIPAVIFYNLITKRITDLIRRAQSVSSYVLSQSVQSRKN